MKLNLNRKQRIVLWIAAIAIIIEDFIILFSTDLSGTRFIATRYIILWAIPVICVALALIVTFSDKWTEWNGENRRDHPRSKKKYQMNYRLYARGVDVVKEVWRNTVTENISTSGICFISDVKYIADDFIELRIKMSQTQGSMECYAKVLNATKIGIVKRKYVITAIFLEMTPGS